MDYSELPEILTAEYPWLIICGCERTTTLDGQYECPKVAKTLKAAFDYVQLLPTTVRDSVTNETPMEIDLTFEEVSKSELPVIVWKTKDCGIIEWVTLKRTTPEELSYLIPKRGDTKVVGILKTCNPEVLDCEWIRSKNLLDNMKIQLNLPQTMDNGDIIQYPINSPEFYFLAVVSRA